MLIELGAPLRIVGQRRESGEHQAGDAIGRGRRRVLDRLGSRGEIRRAVRRSRAALSFLMAVRKTGHSSSLAGSCVHHSTFFLGSWCISPVSWISNTLEATAPSRGVKAPLASSTVHVQ